MKTFKLHFIRNGISEANVQGIYCGSTDSPLSERGRKELLELLEEGDYPYIDILFTSPLSSDIETARILYPGCETRVIDSLKETHFGEFEGRSLDELKLDANFQKWAAPAGEYLPIGAEHPSDFLNRICGATQSIVRTMMNEGIYSAAIVAHMGVISNIFSAMAYPQSDPYNWTCDGGCGYTAIADPILFMREPVLEVIAKVPFPDDYRQDLEITDWDDSQWDPAWDSELQEN